MEQLLIEVAKYLLPAAITVWYCQLAKKNWKLKPLAVAVIVSGLLSIASAATTGAFDKSIVSAIGSIVITWLAVFGISQVYYHAIHKRIKAMIGGTNGKT